MINLLRSLRAAVAATGLLVFGGLSLRAASADRDFAAMQAARAALDRPPVPREKMEPGTYQRWVDTTLQEIGNAALAFHAQHPDDPRRWEAVLIAARIEPTFISNPGRDGAAQDTNAVVVDEAKKKTWRERMDALQGALLASTDATPAMREEVEWNRFLRDFTAASWARYRGEPADFDGLRARFDAHVAKYAQLPQLGGRAVEYLGALRRQRDGPRAVAGWHHLLESTDTDSSAAGIRAIRAEAVAQIELLTLAAGGKQLAAVKFTDLDGREIDLPAMKGRVVLLDFWAMWCPPCVEELPHIKAVYEKYRAAGFEVIGISCDEGTKEKLRAFLEQHGYRWPQHFDGKGTRNYFAQLFDIRAWPATYLIGRDGELIEKNIFNKALEPAVRKALGLDP